MCKLRGLYPEVHEKSFGSIQIIPPPFEFTWLEYRMWRIRSPAYDRRRDKKGY